MLILGNKRLNSGNVPVVSNIVKTWPWLIDKQYKILLWIKHQIASLHISISKHFSGEHALKSLRKTPGLSGHSRNFGNPPPHTTHPTTTHHTSPPHPYSKNAPWFLPLPSRLSPSPLLSSCPLPLPSSHFHTLLICICFCFFNKLLKTIFQDLSEGHPIRLIQCTSWPDHGVPNENTDVLALLTEVESSQRAAGNGPVTVVCR